MTPSCPTLARQLCDDNVDDRKVDFVFKGYKLEMSSHFMITGLFNYEHMNYEALRDAGPEGEPSIIEMTEKAINLLRRKKDRFFLLVEGK